MVGTADISGEIVETSRSDIVVCSLDSRDHRPCTFPQIFFQSVILAVLPAFSIRLLVVSLVGQNVSSNPRSLTEQVDMVTTPRNTHTEVLIIP